MMTRFIDAPMGEGKAELVKDLTWEQIGHLSEMPQSIRNLKEFVEYYTGTRCPENETAWKAVDHLESLVGEFISKTGAKQ